MQRFLPLLILVTTVPACASARGSAGPIEETRVSTAGGNIQYESIVVNPARERRIAADVTATSAALVAAFHEFGLPVTREAAGQRLVLERTVMRTIGNRPISAYLNCGMGGLGPNADFSSIELHIESTLNPIDNNRGTLVRTQVSASAESPDRISRAPVLCRTTHALEDALHTLAETAVVAPVAVATTAQALGASSEDANAPTKRAGRTTTGLAFSLTAGVSPEINHENYGNDIPTFGVGVDFGPFEQLRFHGNLVVFNVAGHCTDPEFRNLGCRSVIYGSEAGGRVYPLGPALARVRPFLDARAGVIGDEEGGNITYGGGAGLDVRLSSMFALRGELQRRYFMQDDVAFNSITFGFRFDP